MTTRKMIFTALFSAIGIVLPQAFHLFGGPTLGATLLPMHLPVFAGAMLLGPVSGIIIAFVSLTTGFMLGMPTMPILAFMYVELIVYAFVSGYLYYSKNINVYVSLTTAKISGMAIELFVIIAVLRIFHVTLPPVFGTVAMFSTGIIGIIIQFILVPIIVTRLRGVFTDDKTY